MKKKKPDYSNVIVIRKPIRPVHRPSKSELIVCPICKEWTTKEENCCNAF